MSYLDPVRLHFAGRFQASPSTVNNDPVHFDTAHFDEKKYQARQSAEDPGGWWNPGGDGAWRLLGCRVTSAWKSDGTAAAADDPVLQCLIADSDRKTTAKIVNLDSEQQLVSMIWGLEVRICTAEGSTLVHGRFEPAAFMDIWNRAVAGIPGDIGAGVMYQSVLSELEWGDVGQSLFLSELKEHAQAGLLSIKFNIDGYNLNFTSPDFTRGRIVGTIGPASAGEPRHFVLGRQFMADQTSQLNHCCAVVDSSAGKIALDLGNALPTADPGGKLVNLGALAVGWVVNQPDGTQAIQAIDGIPYTDAGWYERTAGVIALPASRRLSDQELLAVAQNPLAIQLTDSSGTVSTAIAEPPQGLFVRADKFVYRLDPGDTAQVELHATRYGQPYKGAAVLSSFDPSGLQPSSQIGTPPPVAEPTTAVDFPARVVTDETGRAVLPIRVSDPGNPRGYIDGQVYGVRPALEETLPPAVGYPFNPFHFISLLVFDSFVPVEPPTWHGAIEPILKQAANLYPVMRRILDLGDYESVVANKRLLELAFSLDVTDPNSMPVTRDLSMAKRRVLLRWLADDPPLVGQPPALARAPRRRRVALYRLRLRPSPRWRGARRARSGIGSGSAGAGPDREPLPTLEIRTHHMIHLQPQLFRALQSGGVHAVQEALQNAIMLEHATIPVYLYALYSLDPARNAVIAAIVRSVVIEEMLHMNLACNILNALGGSPVIDTPGFIPTYPGPLPGGVESELKVHLRPFSHDQLADFMKIEEPEEPLHFPVLQTRASCRRTRSDSSTPRSSGRSTC